MLMNGSIEIEVAKIWWPVADKIYYNNPQTYFLECQAICKNIILHCIFILNQRIAKDSGRYREQVISPRNMLNFQISDIQFL